MTSPLEIAATLLALAYLLLAIGERRWCFLAGGLSAVLYGVLFWQVRLYMESGLQLFYVVISVYGFAYWQQAGGQRGIARWPWRTHVLAIAGIGLSTVLVGSLLARHTDAALPYLDSFTTIGALVASWAVARKVLENWLYWVVLDLVSIGLYLQRDLWLTAGLFALYTGLAVVGYRQWQRHWQAQASQC